VHAYKLAIPFEKIIETIEKEERKRIESIERNIEQLKALSQSP
jgi:predicted transcriptional regulator